MVALLIAAPIRIIAKRLHAVRPRSGVAYGSIATGRQMRSGAIRHQTKTRTKEAFGKAIWPHLFRDCAVTELVDCAPEQIGIAPDLLGHAALQTTKKHDIQAVGMKAHARVQEMIAARRRAELRLNDFSGRA